MGLNTRRLRSLGTALLEAASEFRRDRRGNIVVMGAILILPLTVLAGGAADYARARQARSEIQDALDAAVLAGAKADNSAAVAAAAFHTQPGGQVVIAPPVFVVRGDGRFSGTVSAESGNAFLSAASIPSIALRASAVAGVRVPPNDVCLTTLETAAAGLLKSGSSTLTGSGCRFDVRSSAAPAASFSGSGSVGSQQVCVRGATVATNGSTVNNLQLGCTLARPYAAAPPTPPVGDCTPYNTSVPVPPGQTVNPGTYCGDTTISGGATLNPGVYVLRGVNGVPARFVINGTAPVTGNGVFIYFADASTLTLESEGDLRLTAPPTGVHQGVLFHEAPGLPRSEMRFTRSGSGLLRGVVNLPSRNLFIASSGSTTHDQVTLVVNRLAMEGSGVWTFSAAPSSAADRLKGYAHLVE